MLQRWQWLFLYVKLLLELQPLHQECLRVVKLVMGLYHGNQRGNQEKLWDGGINMWVLLYMF